jgi:D-alanine-D-alanine ligase
MKKIGGILMGGSSTEYQISVNSGELVYEALSESEFTPYRILISKDGWFALVDDIKIPIDRNDFSFDLKGSKVIVDVVFNAIHGSPGEDGFMPGYFHLLQIPQTSCDLFESALTFNKAKTNIILSQLGVKCPKGIYLNPATDIDEDSIIKSLGLPLFIKPNRAGSSFGVSKVSKQSEFADAIVEARKEDDETVIESAIHGIEVGCGVVQINGQVQVLAITEIVSKRDFFDYQAKYEGASEEITPARIPESISKKIEEISLFVYSSLSLKGIIRIDYIIDNKTKEPIFIEVNSVPGLSKESIIPKQLDYRQFNRSEFFTLVVKESLKE